MQVLELGAKVAETRQARPVQTQRLLTVAMRCAKEGGGGLQSTHQRQIKMSGLFCLCFVAKGSRMKSGGGKNTVNAFL